MSTALRGPVNMIIQESVKLNSAEIKAREHTNGRL